MEPAPQDIQLMSKHRVLSFKPYLRLEWRGQDGQNETERPDHSASLGDSITSSTRIRFSVHKEPFSAPVRSADLSLGSIIPILAITRQRLPSIAAASSNDLVCFGAFPAGCQRRFRLMSMKRSHHAYAGEHRRPGSSGLIDTARTATIGRVPWQLYIWQRVGCSPNPP
jgi:hypothetical protein